MLVAAADDGHGNLSPYGAAMVLPVLAEWVGDRLVVLRVADESTGINPGDVIRSIDDTPVDETLRALDDMVRSGKVRYIACSNFRAWRLCEALWISDRKNLERFVCVQPLYNLVNRDVEVELLPLCKEHGIGVVSYSPLARGILTGKYSVGQPYPEGSRASRNDPRMMQAEMRDASLEVGRRVHEYAATRGSAASRFALRAARGRRRTRAPRAGRRAGWR